MPGAATGAGTMGNQYSVISTVTHTGPVISTTAASWQYVCGISLFIKVRFAWKRFWSGFRVYQFHRRVEHNAKNEPWNTEDSTNT